MTERGRDGSACWSRMLVGSRRGGAAMSSVRYRAVSESTTAADASDDDDDRLLYEDDDVVVVGDGGVACSGYESIGTCDLLLPGAADGAATSSTRVHPATGAVMTKSLSLPSHMTTSPPDPFPELSRHKMRLYHFQDMERAGDRDVVSETERRSPNSVSSESVVTTDTSLSTTDHLTEVTLVFHNDDHSSHNLSVSGRTTVAQVCDQLVQCNHAMHSPHWTVFERLTRYQLERGIEHHELISQVHRTWSPADEGRFYFRKDFSKYELFRNPTQFFPEHMVETKISSKDDMNGLLTHSERYKNLLLQNLLANQCIPDIQGYVYIREGKRSWKKYFCILRGSGLYCSTKGCQKEPQYLTLLSTLTDVNIFVASNAKKIMNAPTNYGFCLRPAVGQSDIRQFKLFCVEDEQARLCWTTGMRFVKYGAQLRENLRLTLRCDDSSSASDSGTPHDNTNTGLLYVKSRVAMDFSGEQGRVVADPNEALGVAYEEGYNWRKKAALRNTCTTQSAPRSWPPESSADAPATLPPPRPCPMMPIHTNQPWFHGHISRDQSVSLLADHGLVDGVFLVRHSESIPNVFVLSFTHNQKVKHCTIHKMEVDGLIHYSLDGGTTKFMDLIQLVDFYQLNAGALPTQLNYYVTRLL